MNRILVTGSAGSVERSLDGALSHVRRNVSSDGPNLRITEWQLREGLPRLPRRSPRSCRAVRSIEDPVNADLAEARDDEILALSPQADPATPDTSK